MVSTSPNASRVSAWISDGAVEPMVWQRAHAGRRDRVSYWLCVERPRKQVMHKSTGGLYGSTQDWYSGQGFWKREREVA